MDREKTGSSRQANAAEGASDKKPYVKPVLRKLGTVRELTHGTNTKTGK